MSPFPLHWNFQSWLNNLSHKLVVLLNCSLVDIPSGAIAFLPSVITTAPVTLHYPLLYFVIYWRFSLHPSPRVVSWVNGFRKVSCNIWQISFALPYGWSPTLIVFTVAFFVKFLLIFLQKFWVLLAFLLYSFHTFFLFLSSQFCNHF